MNIKEIETMLLNHQIQLKNLGPRQSSRSAQADQKIAETKAETEEVKRESKETSTLLEEALCDIDTAASDRLADLEEALCELSEIMEEGE